jgi:hypothetical protein
MRTRIKSLPCTRVASPEALIESGGGRDNLVSATQLDQIDPKGNPVGTAGDLRIS